MLDIMFGF